MGGRTRRRLKDKGDTNLTMENCLIAAAIYTLAGIIATVLLTRHSPPSSAKTTRTENQRSPLTIGLAQLHNNPFCPPWPLPEQSIKNEIRDPNHPRRFLIVYLEGNIGSGKSTLLKSLKERGWEVYQEPVEDRWKVPLQEFYKGPLL